MVYPIIEWITAAILVLSIIISIDSLGLDQSTRSHSLSSHNDKHDSIVNFLQCSSIHTHVERNRQ
jgi:hypothetical protein